MRFDIGTICNIGLPILWYNAIKNECFPSGKDCKENGEPGLYSI